MGQHKKTTAEICLTKFAVSRKKKVITGGTKQIVVGNRTFLLLHQRIFKVLMVIHQSNISIPGPEDHPEAQILVAIPDIPLAAGAPHALRNSTSQKSCWQRWPCLPTLLHKEFPYQRTGKQERASNCSSSDQLVGNITNSTKTHCWDWQQQSETEHLVSEIGGSMHLVFIVPKMLPVNKFLVSPSQALWWDKILSLILAVSYFSNSPVGYVAIFLNSMLMT